MATPLSGLMELERQKVAQKLLKRINFIDMTEAEADTLGLFYKNKRFLGW